jgi:hypothetical protein
MTAPATPYPYFITKTRVRTQTQIVREVDPDWRAPGSGKDVEYVFSNGRTFSRRLADRFPYTED